ncbi:MAG: SH3 domain-containing protein [Lachnospiraceae bacterium]|nr:SH3 domain-containing protein [Lachnospiraceae bacterium]
MMKKTTINTILISIITVMSVSICFLIFCIITRPRYAIVEESETATIVESVSLSDEPQTQSAAAAASVAAEPVPDVVEETPTTKRGKTSTRVNIRDAASEDAKVLETVDEGTTFDILEIMDNGWTKILYQDYEAYISSNFVIVLND